MSVKSQTAVAIGSLSIAPLAGASPGGLRASLTALGRIARTFLKICEFPEALRGTPRQLPGGDSPHEPQADHNAADSIWNDPAFWMMLNH
jgi:hypothetical protein